MSIRRATATTAAALLLAVVGCGDEGAESTTSASASQCREVEAPAPKKLDLPPPRKKAPTASGVVFETSCGSFTVEFDKRAPRTTASFEYLAEQGAFDATTFHRVVKGQLIQGGDPLGDGTGGPGYFVDEPPPSNLAYTKGVVFMAKTTNEPIGRSGSQFLIVTAEDLGLTPDYALVGRVTEGFEVVQAISDLGEAGADDAPLMPVVIERATTED